MSSESTPLPWANRNQAQASSVAGGSFFGGFLFLFFSGTEDYLDANQGFASSWISRLCETFQENGLENVIVDRHKFSTEVVTLLLDTWMVASQEISVNILDGLGGGQGDVARRLIEEVGKNRQNTAFNLQRVVTIGQKPTT